MSEGDNAEDGSDADLVATIETFADAGLAGVLDDEDVHQACLDQLEKLGCPKWAAPALLFAIKKLAISAERSLKQATFERLKAQALKVAPIRKLVRRWTGKIDAAMARRDLKAALLASTNANPASKADAVRSMNIVDADLEALTVASTMENFASLDKDIAELVNLVATEFADLKTALFEPNLSVREQDNPQTAANYIRYDSGKYPFQGRERELRVLNDFLAARDIKRDEAGRQTDRGLAPFRWLLITGEGGSGKSRLALKCVQDLQMSDWRAGQLPIDALRSEKFDLAQWRPRRPNLIVIDYPAQAPDRVRALLDQFSLHADHYAFPVRVLLLEREAHGDWYNTVFRRDGAGTRIEQAGFEASQSSRPGIYALPDFRAADIAHLIQARLQGAEDAGAGIAAWDANTVAKLASATEDVDKRVDAEGKPRPPRALFAAMVAELFIRRQTEDGMPPDRALASLPREDVLCEIIDRDYDAFWAPAVKAQGADFARHLNVAILATMALGLPKERLANLPAAAGALCVVSEYDHPRMHEDVLGTISGRDATTIRELEPDILGEFLVLRRLGAITDTDIRSDGRGASPRVTGLTAPQRQALIDAAFALSDGDNAGVFVLRCLRDFPDYVKRLGFLAPRPEAGLDAALLFSRLAVDLVNILGDAKAWNPVDDLFQRLDALRAQFGTSETIALEAAKAAVNVTNHAGEAGDWNRVQAMLDRLDALRDRFETNEEIALRDAKAAVNVTVHAGKVGDWDRVDAMRARAFGIARAFSDHPKIIALIAAQSVLAYWFERRAGQTPDEETTETAVLGAWIRIQYNVENNDNFVAQKAFQVIKDGFERFPDNETIAGIYNQIAEQNFDWSKVPPIGLASDDDPSAGESTP
ncbi:MAG: hypothetical protein ACFB2Z_08000 [Maricaulaceae bacterium]